MPRLELSKWRLMLKATRWMNKSRLKAGFDDNEHINIVLCSKIVKPVQMGPKPLIVMSYCMTAP